MPAQHSTSKMVVREDHDNQYLEPFSHNCYHSSVNLKQTERTETLEMLEFSWKGDWNFSASRISEHTTYIFFQLRYTITLETSTDASWSLSYFWPAVRCTNQATWTLLCNRSWRLVELRNVMVVVTQGTMPFHSLFPVVLPWMIPWLSAAF